MSDKTGGRGVRVEMMDCERVLLEETANPAMKRLDVAKSYALMLRSRDRDNVDITKVNAAIVKRWSRSALVWIKDQAWSGKCFAEKQRRGSA